MDVPLAKLQTYLVQWNHRNSRENWNFFENIRATFGAFARFLEIW
jgi:hypothetical protein